MATNCSPAAAAAAAAAEDTLTPLVFVEDERRQEVSRRDFVNQSVVLSKQMLEMGNGIAANVPLVLPASDWEDFKHFFDWFSDDRAFKGPNAAPHPDYPHRGNITYVLNFATKYQFQAVTRRLMTEVLPRHVVFFQDLDGDVLNKTGRAFFQEFVRSHAVWTAAPRLRYGQDDRVILLGVASRLDLREEVLRLIPWLAGDNADRLARLTATIRPEYMRILRSLEEVKYKDDVTPTGDFWHWFDHRGHCMKCKWRNAAADLNRCEQWYKRRCSFCRQFTVCVCGVEYVEEQMRRMNLL